MTLRQRFGSTIGRLRVAAGLSQEKLAELSGLHATTISAVERGRMSITLEKLEGLARGLGISAWDLVRIAATGEAQPDVPEPPQRADYGAGPRRLGFSIVAERTSSGYSAYCPDLPGCAATARSRDEVEGAMREAITAQLQSLRRTGSPIPEPTSYTAVVSVTL
jgi:transcriptional regulator with XRE-family HTH domain/predicted RNase H-like HicB family nuclease